MKLNSLMGMADTMMVTTVGRAAGAVKFPMIVSISSMWGCRVMLCNFLVKMFQFGLIAVWLGMFADWTIRAAIFLTRFLSWKWVHGGMVKQKKGAK